MQYEVFFFSLLLSIFACSKTEPVIEKNYYSGYAYIGCDIGPYYVHSDSLITNCSENQELPPSINLDSLDFNDWCNYDDSNGNLGNANSFEFELRRDNQSIINIAEVQSGSINLNIDGEILSPGEGPYYSGFYAEYENKFVNIYLVNKIIGGCFHDIIIWEITVE